MLGSRGHWSGVAVGVMGTVVSSAPARDDVPGMLFQGGAVVPPPVVEVDPALPTGHRWTWEERPTYVTPRLIRPPKQAADPAHAGQVNAPSSGSAPGGTSTTMGPVLVAPGASLTGSGDRRCDARYPVCVHGGAASEKDAALQHFARAFRVWNYVLQMPPPLADGGLGQGPELDVYLAADPSAEMRVANDPPLLRSDRASVWCEVGASTLTERGAARCIAEASVVAIDAAESPGVRQGWVDYQLDAAYAPATDAFDAFDAAQNTPSAPLLTRERSPRSAAASSFWAYIDDTLGVDGRGKLPLALMRLSTALEPRQEPHPEWRNSPDVLDVLRHAYGNDSKRLSLLWSDWSASRAFLGTRANRRRPHDVAWLGEAARISFDWVVDYSSLPRHLAGPAPLHPLAATYVWVALDSVPLNAVLALRFEWEAPTSFRWAVVSVDAGGREVNRWNLPYLENATSAETTLVHFQQAAGLIIVGTNLGAVDVSHPFDPDQEPWEPHGYSVYLTELSP